MYELDEPYYFYLLILLPILAVIFGYNQIWKIKKQKEFGDLELLKKLSPTKSIFKPILKFLILILSIFFLIFGLVNPKIGTKVEKVKREGIDIVFAIDVSKSMLADDIAPSRIEKSKQLVSQIINNLGTDRIGIIAYAGSAFPVMPITTDFNSAKMFLQSMNVGMVSSQGTSLNAPIELAAKYFESSPKTSKLMIMISDGEDHAEGAEDAAAEAKKLGMKILTIGVGTTTGGPIPLKSNGVLESYQLDKSGAMVTTKLNSEVLENLAKTANGGYVNGNNTKEAIDFVKKQLNTIQKTEFSAIDTANFQSQFQWFLGISFLLLILDVFLLETKTTWVQRLDLFNEIKKK